MYSYCYCPAYHTFWIDVRLRGRHGTTIPDRERERSRERDIERERDREREREREREKREREREIEREEREREREIKQAHVVLVSIPGIVHVP